MIKLFSVKVMDGLIRAPPPPTSLGFVRMSTSRSVLANNSHVLVLILVLCGTHNRSRRRKKRHTLEPGLNKVPANCECRKVRWFMSFAIIV
jgi:hypothetical protein